MIALNFIAMQGHHPPLDFPKICMKYACTQMGDICNI